ncbi:hypothetical protein [Kalamiella sp. sgz302252]
MMFLRRPVGRFWFSADDGEENQGTVEQAPACCSHVNGNMT